MSAPRDHEDDTKNREQAPCLWMPGLYGTGRPATERERACPRIGRLWPGLPAGLAREEGDMAQPSAGRWTPDDLPCTPAMMGAWLRETEQFLHDTAKDGSAAARAVIGERAAAERAALGRETGAVAALLGRGAAEDGKRRQEEKACAQRVLGWVWHQQRCLGEIDALVGSINEVSRQIGKGLGAVVRGAMRATTDVFASPLEGAGEGEGGLDPDWRVVLAAALALVPEGTVFVAEGAMLADLDSRRNEFSFAPDPALCGALGLPEDALEVADCPVAALLGREEGARAGSLPVHVRVALAAGSAAR